MAGGVTGLVIEVGQDRRLREHRERFFCDGHHMTKVLPALGSNASDGQYDRRSPGGSRLPANLEAGPDERVAPLGGLT